MRERYSDQTMRFVMWLYDECRIADKIYPQTFFFKCIWRLKQVILCYISRLYINYCYLCRYKQQLRSDFKSNWLKPILVTGATPRNVQLF